MAKKKKNKVKKKDMIKKIDNFLSKLTPELLDELIERAQSILDDLEEMKQKENDDS